jgi:hypothetical protein
LTGLYAYTDAMNIQDLFQLLPICAVIAGLIIWQIIHYTDKRVEDLGRTLNSRIEDLDKRLNSRIDALQARITEIKHNA